MLLITGCGRSGSRYTATLLNRLGLRVGHEELHADGEIGWKGLRKLLSGERIDFNVILHQVRDPIATISSLRTHCCGLLKDVSRFFPTRSSLDGSNGNLHRCMEYWYEWNLLAESRAIWTYRIEELPQVFDTFCELLGVSANRAALDALPTNINTRRTRRFAKFQRDTVNWDTLESIDRPLTTKIHELAVRYGYQHMAFA